MMASFSVDGVLDALHMQPVRSPGGGRAVMLISAQRGLGVTTATRAVAQAAAATTAYAIDLDLRANSLARGFSDLGPRLSSTLGGANLYAAVDAQKRIVRHAPPSYFYHRVGQSRLFVGQLDQSAFGREYRAWISDRADYWDAARAAGVTMVVDAPSLDRSQVSLRVARHMDGVVLLVGSNPGAAPAALAAKTLLQESGATLIGLVYAGASAPVMALERMLRRSA